MRSNVSFQNNDNYGSFSKHDLNFVDLANLKYYAEIAEAYFHLRQTSKNVSKMESFASSILHI